MDGASAEARASTGRYLSVVRRFGWDLTVESEISGVSNVFGLRTLSGIFLQFYILHLFMSHLSTLSSQIVFRVSNYHMILVNRIPEVIVLVTGL